MRRKDLVKGMQVASKIHPKTVFTVVTTDPVKKNPAYERFHGVPVYLPATNRATGVLVTSERTGQYVLPLKRMITVEERKALDDALREARLEKIRERTQMHERIDDAVEALIQLGVRPLYTLPSALRRNDVARISVSLDMAEEIIEHLKATGFEPNEQVVRAQVEDA